MEKERMKELNEIVKTVNTKGWIFIERWLREQAEGSDTKVHNIKLPQTERELENGKVFAYGSILLKVKSIREELDKD